MSDKPTTVLFAEDDLNHLDLFRRALKQTGFDWSTITVPDGEQAIDYLAGRGRFWNRKEFPLPNLVLLDLKMPRKSGFEVLEWLQEHRSASQPLQNVRVVVLTASGCIDDANRAYQLGAASFLTKPVQFNAFRDMVGACVSYWTSLNQPGPTTWTE